MLLYNFTVQNNKAVPSFTADIAYSTIINLINQYDPESIKHIIVYEAGHRDVGNDSFLYQYFRNNLVYSFYVFNNNLHLELNHKTYGESYDFELSDEQYHILSLKLLEVQKRYQDLFLKKYVVDENSKDYFDKLAEPDAHTN